LLGRLGDDSEGVHGVGSEFWCAAMRTNKDEPADRKASAMAAPVCGRLRVLFEDVAAQSMPDQLQRLAVRLDAALERGDLLAPKIKS
jgi:hypothetical protein